MLPPPELDVLLELCEPELEVLPELGEPELDDPDCGSPQHIHIEGSPQEVSMIVWRQTEPVDWQVPPSCKQERPAPELDPLEPPELLELLGAPELLLDEVELAQQIWATKSPQEASNWGIGFAHGEPGERHEPPAVKQSGTEPPELDVLPELGPPELLELLGAPELPPELLELLGAPELPPELLLDEGAPLELPELDELPPELEVLPPELDVLPPPELDEVPPELVDPLEEPGPPSRSSPIGSVVPPHAATTGSMIRTRRSRVQRAVERCDWSMPLIGQCSAVL